jgi:hypothetical protein
LLFRDSLIDVERNVHVPEWVGLSKEIGDALITGVMLLNSTAPLTPEERAELSASVEAIAKLLRAVAETALSMSNDPNLVGQLTASGERVREELRNHNELIGKLTQRLISETESG